MVIDGVLYGRDAEVALWVNERIGGGLVKTLFVAFGVIAEDVDPDAAVDPSKPVRLAAGAYFYNWRHDGGISDIHAAVAVDDVTRLHPAVIRRILSYPFEDLKVRRISVEIEMANAEPRSFRLRNAQALGFQLEGTKMHMGPKGPYGMFGLYPQSCPFWTRGEQAA